MARHEDLYRCLELTSSCSAADIKKAYRRLVLLHHPDKNPDAPPEIFQKIQQAYEILSDADQRAKYDRDGLRSDNDASTTSAANGADDLDNFFASLFTQNGAGPSRPYRKTPSSASPKPKQKQRMPDQHMGVIDITMEEGFTGVDREFDLRKLVVCRDCEGCGAKSKSKLRACSDCGGSGEQNNHQMHFFATSSQSCITCKGTGKVCSSRDNCTHCRGQRVVSVTKKITLSISRGARTGDTILFEGETDQRPGWTPGDVTFTLKATITLTLSEALLGFERVILTHLDGKGLTVKQPGPGMPDYRVITHGDTLVIKGEGYPGRHKTSRGDLIVTVCVQMPTQAEMLAMSEKHQRYLARALPPKRENVLSGAGSREVVFES